MSDPEPAPTNGATATLAKLLNQLNLPTLAAIFLMGGGNFLATKSTSEEQRQVVFHNIKEMHDALDEFESRQKTILEGNGNLLRNQIQMLDNQSKMLEQLKQRQDNHDARYHSDVSVVPLKPSGPER